MITFIVNNHVKEEDNAKAEAWEKEFIKFMKSYKNSNMTISFSAEVSVKKDCLMSGITLKSLSDNINLQQLSPFTMIIFSLVIIILSLFCQQGLLLMHDEVAFRHTRVYLKTCICIYL